MNKTWVFVGILLQHSVTAQSAITSIGVVRGWSCSVTVGKKSKKMKSDVQHRAVGNIHWT